jgi:putative ABC transport system ATP-binding protein
MSQLIELTGVSKVYNGAARQAALENVTATVDEGEFVATMGASGSGKSTLLNLIAGLDRPTEGTIVVAGIDLGELGESALARYRREKLGFIFQFFNLLGNLRVLENVLIPAQLAGVPSVVATKRARQLLEELEIGDRADLYPAQLSGGERQRVAIARSLVNRPSVLLADEPTGALDSRNGDHVMELLSRLNQGGQTIVLVTHDAKLAACYARRVLTLRDGQVVDDTRLDSRPDVTAADLIQVRVGEVGR